MDMPQEELGEFFDPDLDEDIGYSDVAGLPETLVDEDIPDKTSGTEMGQGMEMDFRIFPEPDSKGPGFDDDDNDQNDNPDDGGYEESLF
jgi:hypothetical protein